MHTHLDPTDNTAFAVHLTFDLEGCPFCGSPGVWVDLKGEPVFQVRCQHCTLTVETPRCATAADAASLWNRRIMRPGMAPALASEGRTVRRARWRAVDAGVQLIASLWWVAFIGPATVPEHEGKWRWQVANRNRHGFAASPEEAVREVTAIIGNDPADDYQIINPDSAEFYLGHPRFQRPALAA